jgi:beta-glucosidase
MSATSPSLRRRGGALLVAAAAALAAFAPGAHAAAAPTAQCPWMDASKTPAERANQLVSAMTLDDEIAMVHDSDPIIFFHNGAAGSIAAIPRLCVPDLVTTDGVAGIAQQTQGTTAYANGAAKAASFDLDLQQRFGRALGWEAWHKGVNSVMTPTLNVVRVPQNGRNGEYFGEDPFLSAESAVATIRGIQRNPVMATAQHFLLNDQQDDEDGVDVHVDERAMREIYMPAWEAAIERAGLGSLLCSVNKVDGTHSCANKALLDVLRDDWHMDGFVMSDWGAVHSPLDALAGTDMEMGALPDSAFFNAPLKAAVQDGSVPKARLDQMVRDIVRTMFRIGIFDHPAPQGVEALAADTATSANVALARRTAAEGTVLLKNDGGVLPLGGRGKKVAVIGPGAGPLGAAFSYSSWGSPHAPMLGAPLGLVSPLEGIKRRARANGDTVLYADGSVIGSDAVNVARHADVAVVFVYDAETEAEDRPNLTLHAGYCPFPLFGADGRLCRFLPIDQNALIAAVASVNPNTIVVVNSGGPVLMPWLRNVKGVLEEWYPGQEGGNAIASLLYGDVNPSAKLPMTFPASESDVPASTPQQYPGVDGRVDYSEGLEVGYRWYDAHGVTPLFPFGFGLSYTTFEYSGLSVERRGAGAAVTFTVRNSGRRAGADVPQVYVGMPASAGEPPKQLKGFARVSLRPGESRRVTIRLDARAFSVWDVGAHDWEVAPGCHRVMLAHSSREVALTASIAMRAGSGATCPSVTSARRHTSRHG